MPTVYSPPVSTYVALATVTLGGSDAEIEFASIPSSYRDLVLIGNSVGASGGENLTPKVNGSSSDFTWVQMTSGLVSNTGSNNSIGAMGTGNTFIRLDFLDYSATDKHKTFIAQTRTTADLRVLAARWAQTTAISSVSVSIRTGFTFSAGSTFSLYAIAS